MRVTAFVCALFAFAVVAVVVARPVAHAADLESRVSAVEDKIDRVDSNVSGFGGLAFLCGVVCALWAQNTGRNAWLWFFLGAIFSAITAVVMLVKNAADLETRRRPPPEADAV